MVRDKLAAAAGTPAREDIPHCLCFEDVAFEGIVPRHVVRSLGEVFLVHDLQPDSDEGLTSLGDGTHLGDAVPDFDVVRKLLMLGDRRVPLIGHAPFVDSKLKLW